MLRREVEKSDKRFEVFEKIILREDKYDRCDPVKWVECSDGSRKQKSRRVDMAESGHLDRISI